MNKGFVLDAINFDINNKLIYIFSENSMMEKYFIYQPKNNFDLINKHNRLDYMMIIEYEYQNKGQKFFYEIIDDFVTIKNSLNSLLLGSIICDLIKNSIQIEEKTIFQYQNIVDFIKLIFLKNDFNKNFIFSYIILLIFYLLLNSGRFILPEKDSIFYDTHNLKFVSDKNMVNSYKMKESNQIYINNINNDRFIRCPKELFVLNELDIKNCISIQNLNLLENLNSDKLNNLLFFLSNLFNLAYHKKRVNSLTFIKYII